MKQKDFCCRCKSDFEHKSERSFQMGSLTELKHAPRKIKQQFREWLEHDAGKYLCGNCYFDLTDED